MTPIIFLSPWIPNGLEEYASEIMEAEEYPTINYDKIYQDLVGLYSKIGIFKQLNEKLKKYKFQLTEYEYLKPTNEIACKYELDKNFSRIDLWEARGEWRIPSSIGFASYIESDQQIKSLLENNVEFCLLAIATKVFNAMMQDEKAYMPIYHAITDKILDYID